MAILLAVAFVLVMLLPKVPVVGEAATDWDDAGATRPASGGPGLLGLPGGLFKKKERGPSLQERLRVREEEQRKALEATKAPAAEQRRRDLDAATDEPDAAERSASGPQLPAT